MKQHAPAAERNAAPILSVLERVLPREARVLEVASGTGQHAVHFAAALPSVTWQPSDVDDVALASIAAWRAEALLPNLLPPMTLDVTSEPWSVSGPYDAIFSANLIHISPWLATECLLRNGARVLKSGGLMMLYGPFILPDLPTAPSNVAFDQSLRSRNEAWGIRRLIDVERLAREAGLTLDDVVAMPANNVVVVFRA